MVDSPAAIPQWWARGILFENCNCHLLCRGHISWKLPCDYERCLGFWAIAHSFLGQPDVIITGFATVSSAAPITVRPGDALDIDATIDLTIQVGG